MIDTAGGSTSAPAGEAAIPESPAPNIVHLTCRCPGEPHPYDTVRLRPKGTLQMGMALNRVLRDAGGDLGKIEAWGSMEFLRWGIESWTFVQDIVVDGRPVRLGVPVTEPVERDVLERWLPFGNGGLEVIEAATLLYREMIDPFEARSLTRLRRGASAASKEPTPSTSAKNGSGPRSPKRSKPSSPPSSAGRPSADPAP